MKLRRDISNISLLFTSLSCMVGSGWLFGALYAARTAGPAAIISWMIGGFLVIFIALTYSELSTMLPLAGGVARYSQLSHGTLVSFCMSWLAWLSCVAVAPTEVQALLQYSATHFHWLIYHVNGTPLLTPRGLICAASLLLLMSIINTSTIKLQGYALDSTNHYM